MSNVSDGEWEFPSAGVTQLVECDLAKVDVAGSNPVSRSKNFSSPSTDFMQRLSADEMLAPNSLWAQHPFSFRRAGGDVRRMRARRQRY
jgi:hypothetical protein